MTDFLTKRIDSILPKRIGESIRIANRNAVLTTHLILDQKVKGQGNRVTKCKNIFKEIEWLAWVCTHCLFIEQFLSAVWIQFLSFIKLANVYMYNAAVLQVVQLLELSTQSIAISSTAT